MRVNTESLLVIDDEAGICKTIQSILESETLRVFSSTNAAEGLQLLRDESPYVVLLDIRLGKQSGFELFQKIRDVDPKALIIFITGHGTADTAIEAMKVGAFDYLVKPLDFDRLLVSNALKAADGLQSRTAEILGLSRPTLRAKIRAMDSEIGELNPVD